MSPADSPSASGIAPPARPQPPLAAAVAATLAWWREAGVDSLFEDEPRRWLAPAKDQPYVLGLAMVLGGFGMVLPEGLAKRVAAAEQSAAPPK